MKSKGFVHIEIFIAIGVLVIIGLLLFSTTKMPPHKEEPVGIAGNQEVVSPTPEPTPSPTSRPVEHEIVTDSSTNTLTTSEGVLSFPAFSITYPSSWNEEFISEITGDEGYLVLKLNKNGSQLRIYQAAYGGTGCKYPDETNWSGPFGSFSSGHVEFSAKMGTLRYGESDNLEQNGNETHEDEMRVYSFCHKNGGFFGNITPYGMIGFSTSEALGSNIFTEVENIIKSIKTVR